MTSVRHFLTLADLSPAELNQVLDRAIELKALRNAGQLHQPFVGKVLGMIFEKSSTRTRVSFESGMAQMGGSAIFLSPNDTQLGRGVEDSAKVISRMVDIVMIRTFEQAMIETFARHSKVPVINGLTDDYHPCQVLADMQTIKEVLGRTSDFTLAWVGDGNNMCHTLMSAAKAFGFHLQIATPAGYEPLQKVQDKYAGHFTLFSDPAEAVKNADVVATDVWASMGQEDEQKQRLKDFAGYCVDGPLMAKANKKAIFLHCLPAHRGEEVCAEVIDGPQSCVWQEAENRLHVQKALMEFLLQA
jgi:ornithine carbamoyltransferase